MLAQENDTSVWRFLLRSFQYPLFVIPAKILLSEFPECPEPFLSKIIVPENRLHWYHFSCILTMEADNPGISIPYNFILGSK
jgi:hypothetical protein